MQASIPPRLTLRRSLATLVAVVVIGCTAPVPSLASPNAPLPRVSDIPSDQDIRRAQVDTATAAGLVREIEGTLQAAGNQLQDAQLVAVRAQDSFTTALVDLDVRRSAADLAEQRAREARTRLTAAEEQVGRLAGDLYRSGGMNPGIESVIDGSDPDEVMYRASTLYGLSSTSTRTLEDADTASAAWTSLTKDADAARRAAQEAADTAAAAGAEARGAADDAQHLVEEKEAERSTLVAQLATLRKTTAELEEQRIAGLEQARRERDLARVIAESTAAAAAAPVALPAPSTAVAPPLREPAPLGAGVSPAVSAVAPATPEPAAPSAAQPIRALPAPVEDSAPPRPTPAPSPVAPPPPIRPAPATVRPAPVQSAPAAPAPVQPAPAAPEPPAPPAPAPPGTATPAGSGAGAVALSYALSKQGAPYYYAWGGNGPLGYDCSGLTQQAFASAGVPLPRTAAQQYSAVRHVPLSDLQLGDLVFWGNGADIWHVAIYIGGNRVINALNPTNGIAVTDLANMGGMGPLNPSAGRV
ncbi:C40 family peptidase [Arthrobacter agilis]|uniref:C40 family peptidase n=1 Tax=Arthrobacter agilis TaxID=37921 RepID=UPI002365618C|nr:C40 family peptidase [Arthrobacter agilis]WDF33604.1 C40 family peptidase [Arthrobacter agilis]